MIVSNLVLFLLSCILLVLSGSFTVKSLSKISQFLRMSEFVAAFIIMSIATSLPELFVGISSALVGNPTLSLGNVIGSNIVDLTLIIGIPILLAKGIKVESKTVIKDARYMLLIAIAPLILMLLGNSLSRIDGVILLSIFIFYFWRLSKRRAEFTKELKSKTNRSLVISNVFLFVVSIIILFLSAHFLVRYATSLSIDLALPSIFIGLFLVSIGTSLPELVFQVRSVQTGHPSMALGDVIGAVVVNSTLVLGVTSIIHPISAPFLLFFISFLFLIIIAFLFVTFISSGMKLDWEEGISLILFYVLFLIVEIYINSVSLR